jgi:hypothetical protein
VVWWCAKDRGVRMIGPVRGWRPLNELSAPVLMHVQNIYFFYRYITTFLVGC